ncbi:MAG: hypothetical protein GON13_02660 [Nanoarchaeota archaeon]|nr:hypothetical protein [Nanoarchaeota archaeon]
MSGMISAGTIIALVVGAGMLGLPFVISQAGFWNGVFQIVFLGLMITVLNLFVGEVVLRTKGNHQLVVLAKRYLGVNAKRLMFWAFILSQYGALTAYLVGINSVLVNVFGFYGHLISYLVIGAMFILLLFRLHVIARAESFLSLLLVGVILLLCMFIVPNSRFENFSIISSTPFVGYGVILFGFMGFTIIPEVAREMNDDKKNLAKIIMFSYGVIIFLYVLFSYSFVGVFGSSVDSVATQSLTGGLLFIGAFMTLLLFVTSFLAIGVVMKDMFMLDMKFKKRVPWFLTLAVPLFAWLVLQPGFIGILSVIGSFSGGVIGCMICLMVIKSREKSNRKPEFVVGGSDFLPYLMMIILIAGMAWQISVLI